MAGYESIFEDGDNPYVSDETTRALARRSQAPSTAPVELVDPYKGNWLAETTRSQSINLANDLTHGLGFLGAGLVGADDVRQDQANKYLEGMQRAREAGPEIQSFEDARDAGGGVLDYGKALGYQAAALVPDVAMSLTGIGLGEVAGKRVATGLVRRSIADAVERRAGSVAAQIADKRAARSTARQLAATAPDDVNAVSNAVRVADAQVTENSRKAAMDVAVRVSGRTPRVGANPFQETIATVAKNTGRVGGTVAAVPSLNGQMNVEKAADPNTTTADMWKLAAGTTAAAATQVIPLERFMSKFGAKAATDVAKHGEKFMPELVKEFGKQGLAEGSQEVAQQALQLASHAWVEKNLDRLTDDDAIDSYISSFAAGGLLGGAMGAGGVGARGAAKGVAAGARKAVDKIQQGSQWTREKVAEGLGAYAERARRARVEPGQPISASGEPVAAGLTPRDRLRQGMDAVANVGNTIIAAGKSAADRFRNFNDDIEFDEDLSRRIDAVHQAWEQGGQPMILGERRAKNQNPVAIKDPLQAHLMSYVRADSPVWGMPEATQRVAKALGRLFEGNPTRQDRVDLEGLVDSGSLPRETMDSMAIIGQQWNGLHKLVRRTGMDTDAAEHVPQTAEQSAVSEQYDPTQEEIDAGEQSRAEGDLINAALDERRGRSADPTTPAERVANAHMASKADPDNEEKYAEFQAARAELRASLIGANEKSGGGAVIVENPNGKGAEAWRRVAHEIETSANRVELEPVNVGDRKEMMRRRALSIDSLVARYVNQIDQYDTNTPEGEQARARAALFQVFADLKSAGVKIAPDTITAGWLGKDGRAQNGTFLGKITPRDAAELRAMWTKGGDVKAGQAARASLPLTKGEAKRAANAKPGDIDAAYGTEREEARQGEHEIDSGNVDTHDRTLAPRSKPTGAKSADGDFVSTTSNIEDVRGSDKLGEIARRARKEAVDLGLADHESPVRVEGEDTGKQRPPAQPAVKGGVSDPRFKAGIEIGLKKLEAERDSGAISERRFNVQVNRLQNIESGLAAKYYNDALKGKFVEASVPEVKADKGVVNTREQRHEDAENAENPEPKMAPPVPVAKTLGNDPDKGRPAPKEKDAQLANAKTEDEYNTAIEDNSDPSTREETSAPKKRLFKSRDFHDDIETTLNEKGEHDVERETNMLNALLEAMGIKDKITVLGDARPGKSRNGTYRSGMGQILIGPELHGAERMEVMAHELGHHIIMSEIARAARAGNPSVKITDLPITENDRFGILKQHNPELYNALRADFEKWKAANPTSQQSRVTRASRAAMHRAMAHLGTNAVKSADELTVEQAQYLYSFDEYLADQISRALTKGKQGRSIIDKFFAGIADMLRKAYAALTLSEHREWKPAPSVDKWVKSLFDRNVADVKQATGKTLPPKAARASVRAAAADSIDGAQFDRSNLMDLVNFIKYTLPKNERAILDRVFNRPAANMLLRKHFEGHPDFVDLIDDARQGMESRIALGYIAWKEGGFKTGPEGRQAFKGIRDSLAELAGASAEGELAERVLNDISNGTVQHFVDRSKTYSVRELEGRARGNAQRALNWVSEQGPISNALAKFWQGTYDRMASTGIPAMREIGALLQRPHGATGDDRGLIVDTRTSTYRFHRKVEGALKGLDPGERVRALSVLQRGAAAGNAIYDKKSPKVRAAVDAMRAVMEEAHQYMVETGVLKADQKRADFFPVIMDVRGEDAGAKLEKLYSQPKFEAAIRKVFDADENEPIEKLVKKMVAMASHDPNSFDPLKPEGKIGFRHLTKRVSQFVYDEGNAEDVRTFASLQTKNIDEVFARYFAPMVKFAEYKRRESAINTALSEIEKQGGSAEDVTLARNAIRAAMGTYGMDGSPTLAALSPDLAKKFSGPKTKAFVQGTQAYENLRLLPLAILSSLVDPMGIAVRSGGDFKATWEGTRAGIRSLSDKKAAKEMLAMLEEIGVADDFLPAIAAHPVFDNDNSSFARKINEAVFKWNGMNAWVRATRVMAAHAGHRFLLKHAAGDSDDSRRYLAELGIAASDIVEDPNKPGQVVLNDKTRGALQQFTDEAVLRPNAMQAPLWHRDPYMGVLTQYKAFGYAIYDQITNRIFRELDHGNFRVLLAAAAYLPIIVMAELLRELIQFGGEGNPNREEWGPGDYTLYATSRSGLLGPQAGISSDIKDDVERNRLPGTSLLGPGGQQAGNVVRALEGQRDLGKEFESALPASAAYKAWNDGRETAEAA